MDPDCLPGSGNSRYKLGLASFVTSRVDLVQAGGGSTGWLGDRTQGDCNRLSREQKGGGGAWAWAEEMGRERNVSQRQGFYL